MRAFTCPDCRHLVVFENLVCLNSGTETAKRRLIFELLELGLPVVGFGERDGGLAFDLLNSAQTEVTTGHDAGLITLDLAEADDAHRERMRTQMGEPYRTLLGHMRHEIAHYYEPILCPEGSSARDRYREYFGDERADYQEAMDRHYANGAPDDWAAEFVSAYRSTAISRARAAASTAQVDSCGRWVSALVTVLWSVREQLSTRMS